MSRMGASDTVVVKPTNNVYTVLALVALLVVLGSLFVLYSRANTLFGDGGLMK